MISGILCFLFAVCEPIAPPVTGPPTWDQTAELAIPLIERWEGLPCEGQRCEAYLDRIASPPVWTICSGITVGVGPGDVRTPAECRADLRREAERYWRGFRGALGPAALGILTVSPDAALTSWTYNIGIGAAGRSTAVRRLNAGDLRGACEASTWFNRAGGRQIRGLVNRRADEYALCVRGL